MSAMHFLTITPDELKGPGEVQWGFELITGWVYSAPQDGAAPLYRFRQTSSNLHFYTSDPAGENGNATALGYVIEHGGAPECYTPVAGTPGAVPIYRWYDPVEGDHLYTQDKNGEKGPPAYGSEGIGFYAFADSMPNTVPLKRYVTGSQAYCYMWTKNGEFQNAQGFNAANASSAREYCKDFVRQMREMFGDGSIDDYSDRQLHAGGCP